MPFVKGDKRINKNGRPKGSKNKDEFKELWDSLKPPEWLVDKAIEQIEKGNPVVLNKMIERYHGKAKETHDINIDGIEIVFTNKSKK